MAGDGGLDLGGIDVLAAADDHVLQPVADVDEAILVHVAAVTGMHPAIAQRLGGCFRLLPVAEHDVRPLHHDLAHGAARHLVVVGVDDAYLGAAGGLAGGVHLAALLVLGGVVLGTESGGDRRQLGHAVALAEACTGEGLAGAVEQHLGDGRGAVADDADARQIVLRRQLRIVVTPVQHHLDHGRRQQDLVDPFAGNGFEHALRGEGRQHDMSAAADEQCSHRRKVRQVEHRHRVQEDAVVGEATTSQRRRRGKEQVVVAEHHALGEAGGAAGVEDPQQRIATAAGVLHGSGRGDQRLVGHHAGRAFAVAGIDHLADRLRLRSDPGAKVLESVVDDQYDGFRIIHGVDDFRRAPADVDRIDHRVRPRHRQVVLDAARRVDGQHGHTLATGDTHALQRAGESRHAVAELGVGHVVAVAANGDGVGALLQLTVQPLGYVHHANELRSCCY
ncbi:hypothetical protein D3C78_915290 [compost metagenome]